MLFPVARAQCSAFIYALIMGEDKLSENINAFPSAAVCSRESASRPLSFRVLEGRFRFVIHSTMKYRNLAEYLQSILPKKNYEGIGQYN